MISYFFQRLRSATPWCSVVVLTLLVGCTGSTESAPSTQQAASDSLQTNENTAIQSTLEAMEFSAIVQKKMELEQYMTIDEETKIVTFNEVAARAGGHEESIIALSREMMAHQNQMMIKMKADGISDVTKVDVSIEPFPLAQRFQERARANIEKARVSNPPDKNPEQTGR